MELADVDRLASLDDRDLERLRAALAPLDATFLAKLARVGERLDDPMRAPMRAWHARRSPEAAAVLARLFVLHDPVTRNEAERALGPLAPFANAGLIDMGERVASRARLEVLGAAADALRVFGDRTLAGEGVPPLNAVTALLARAALPAARPGAGTSLEAVLDLGCGAGAIALSFTRVARRVVATDVNPRALAWTRFNARLNGVMGVELRLGDRYAPVPGERFDRIASQPPFLAHRAGAAHSRYAHGGARGDELPLEVLREAALHLSPGGRAVVLADWPLAGGIDAPIDARVRAALGDAGGIVFTSPPKNLDEYCVSLAAGEHPQLDAAFSAAACAQRDHFEALGLRGVAQALVVVDGALRETALVGVRHAHDAPVTAADVDRVVAAHALASSEADALLDACLRVPDGSRVVEQPTLDGAPPAFIVQLPATRPEWPAILTPAAASVVRAVHQAASVRQALAALAHDEALAAVRQALRAGALELASRP